MSNLSLSLHLRPSEGEDAKPHLYKDEDGGWITLGDLTIHFGDRLDVALSLATACLELVRVARIRQAALKAGENGDDLDRAPVPEAIEEHEA